MGVEIRGATCSVKPLIRGFARSSNGSMGLAFRQGGFCPSQENGIFGHWASRRSMQNIVAPMPGYVVRVNRELLGPPPSKMGLSSVRAATARRSMSVRFWVESCR